MAFLFADSFDFYASVSDIALRWNAVNTSNALSTQTAFGVGQCVSLSSTSTQALVVSFASNEATIFMSLRARFTANAAIGPLALIFCDGAAATSQVTINWQLNGTIEVRTGGVSGTLLGSVARAHNPGVWDGYQIKVVINNTTGSVEIRKNGSTTPILALTNVNTRGGSTNNYANMVVFNANSVSNQAFQVDDVWFNSGSGGAPNDWPGDVRAYQQLPSGAGSSTQFTPNPASLQYQFTTLTNGSLSCTANIVRFRQVTPTAGGTLASLFCNLSAGITGHCKLALYSDSGGAPGTLLATSAEATNPSAGVLTLSVTSGPVLAAGTPYWIGLLNDATLATLGNSLSGTAATLSQTYASGFPSFAAGVQVNFTTNGLNLGMNLTAANWSSVADAIEDGDSSTVQSSTAGQEDLYTLAAVPSLVTILGVNYYALAKKSDAGARSGGLQLIANGSADTNIANSALSASYAVLSAFQPLDPTGAAWTQSTINGAQLGVKVTA